jgi:dUTP pyrophosphatase
MTEIKFKKLVPEAKAPQRAYIDDAGFDLFAISKEETKDYIEYLTGIAVEIPSGMVGLVFPRSSITNKDLMLKNSVGIIDSQFRGEIRCRYYNIKGTPRQIEILHQGIVEKISGLGINENIYEIGDRVAQIVFLKLPEITLVESDELSNSDRGVGGFGSTNKI